MLGTILAFCFFGFCSGGGHWHHPHHHRHDHFGAATHREDDERIEAADELVPADWRAVPADAHERKFVSPSGSAELKANWTVTSQQPIAKHMRDVAFERGEKLSYIQGGSDWIAVSGIRDDRQFYRQAVLACEGRQWHQIEIDYPVADVRDMAKLIARSSHALSHTRNAGCDSEDPPEQPATTHVAPANDAGPGGTTGSGVRAETPAQTPQAAPPVPVGGSASH